MKYSSLGDTGIQLPKIIFGTSALGNLYQATPFTTKLEIIQESFKHVEYPVFDSAGKYGAGLALESLGECLNELNIDPDKVFISNKLGWLRTELKTEQPTFEKGIWFDIKNDAEQHISYNGIISCFDQGNDLLGGKYSPQLLSVHDPDEYINQGSTEQQKEERFADILDAYKALSDLKKQDRTKAIGIGAKDWTVIKKVAAHIKLDWAMFANSLTIMNHPTELISFIDHLKQSGVTVINSAVFQSGFLTGSDYYDYKRITPQSDPLKYKWRETFFGLCKKFSIKPAVACVNFAMTHPGVSSISLNTSNPDRIKENVDSVLAEVPKEFYAEMVNQELISANYPYLGL